MNFHITKVFGSLRGLFKSVGKNKQKFVTGSWHDDKILKALGVKQFGILIAREGISKSKGGLDEDAVRGRAWIFYGIIFGGEPQISSNPLPYSFQLQKLVQSLIHDLS